MLDNQNENLKDYAFFEHIDEIRKRLIWFLSFYLVFVIICFLKIEFIFSQIILPPKSDSFATFKLVCEIGKILQIENLCNIKANFFLINIEMAGQFTAHIKIAFLSALVLAFPILLYQIWLFIKPGLYVIEKKKFKSFVFWGSILFFIGIFFAYFVILPFAVMFLGNYKISYEIANQINMKSYISLFSSTLLLTGVLFQLPLVIVIFTKIGIINPKTLKKYRRHGILASFILAAIITPTTDIFTLCLVAFPLLILYEAGIFLSSRIYNKQNLQK